MDSGGLDANVNAGDGDAGASTSAVGMERLSLNRVDVSSGGVEEGSARGAPRVLLEDSSNGDRARGGGEVLSPNIYAENVDAKGNGTGSDVGHRRESAVLEAAGGMRNALANPETSQALASASAALREVRSKASGLTSDDQASVFDKVIHQQRMQLEQLRLEKAAFEKERAEFKSKVAMAPLASGGEAGGREHDAPEGLISRVGAGVGAGAGRLLPELQRQVREIDVEKMVKKIRNPKRVAAMCCIVFFCLALFVRTQRRMDQVGSMDATQLDLQIEHS